MITLHTCKWFLCIACNNVVQPLNQLYLPKRIPSIWRNSPTPQYYMQEKSERNECIWPPEDKNIHSRFIQTSSNPNVYKQENGYIMD